MKSSFIRSKEGRTHGPSLLEDWRNRAPSQMDTCLVSINDGITTHWLFSSLSSCYSCCRLMVQVSWEPGPQSQHQGGAHTPWSFWEHMLSGHRVSMRGSLGPKHSHGASSLRLVAKHGPYTFLQVRITEKNRRRRKNTRVFWGKSKSRHFYEKQRIWNMAISGRYLNSWTRCAVILEPELANGWPKAMAPPFTLVLLGSRSKLFWTARYWGAKASFTFK